MPKFICPIDWCKHHTGVDCELDTIYVSPRSDDWDVTIACNHQEKRPKVCNRCGKEISEYDICDDCE